jgi:hypothetical protein
MGQPAAEDNESCCCCRCCRAASASGQIDGRPTAALKIIGVRRIGRSDASGADFSSAGEPLVGGGRLATCRNSSWLRQLHGATAQPISQTHSRFHPVPTQPVFSPLCERFPGAAEETVPAEPVLRPAPFKGGGAPIEPTPTAPLPEEVLAPRSSPKKTGRATEIPRRLGIASGAQQVPSWIFSTPTPYTEPPRISQAQVPAGQQGREVRR